MRTSAWTGWNLEVNYIAGTPYVGAEVKMKPGPGGHRGAMTGGSGDAPARPGR